MTFKLAKNIADKFTKSFGEGILKAFKVKDGYVFLTGSKNENDGKISNPYIIVYNNGKIGRYSILENSEEFKRASKINLLESVN